MRLWEGFTGIHEGFVGVHETLGKDLQGFMRLWERIFMNLWDFGKGFLGIPEDSPEFWKGFARLWERICEDSWEWDYWKDTQNSWDFGKGFTGIYENLWGFMKGLFGFMRLWGRFCMDLWDFGEGFLGFPGIPEIHLTLENDLLHFGKGFVGIHGDFSWGFGKGAARVWGKGFVRIVETLGKDSQEMARLWERICEDSQDFWKGFMGIWEDL